MTTTGDLYQQAWKAWTDCYLSPDGKPFNAVCAVVDLALAARPEMTDVEVLREARQIGYDLIGPMIWLDEIARLADRLEVDYRAEQEKAEREKLIEQAAFIVAATRDHGPDRTVSIQDRQMAEGLLAAGLLSAPESDGGAA